MTAWVTFSSCSHSISGKASYFQMIYLKVEHLVSMALLFVDRLFKVDPWSSEL